MENPPEETQTKSVCVTRQFRPTEPINPQESALGKNSKASDGNLTSGLSTWPAYGAGRCHRSSSDRSLIPALIVRAVLRCQGRERQTEPHIPADFCSRVDRAGGWRWAGQKVKQGQFAPGSLRCRCPQSRHTVFQHHTREVRTVRQSRGRRAHCAMHGPRAFHP